MLFVIVLGRAGNGPSANAAGREEETIDPKAQINLTHEESRIMGDGTNRGSFVRAYNCQAMVDGKAQIIVAAGRPKPPRTISRWCRWPTRPFATRG